MNDDFILKIDPQWSDIVVLLDSIERLEDEVIWDLDWRRELEAKWIDTTPKHFRPTAIASMLERLYPDDAALQIIARVLRENPRQRKMMDGERYLSFIQKNLDDGMSETEALELLADRLEKITGKDDIDPESLRRVINNFRNKKSSED
ncbi:MAG: hypothetical protein ACON5J_19825 [Rubripirellula sp.]